MASQRLIDCDHATPLIRSLVVTALLILRPVKRINFTVKCISIMNVEQSSCAMEGAAM
jgi:hypothetical protein